MGVEIHEDGYRIWSPHTIPPPGSGGAADANIDVHVIFNDSRRYIGTLVTLEAIRRLMEEYRITGECENGLYLWAKGLVIIDELSVGTLRACISSLVRTGEIASAFEGPFLDDLDSGHT